MNIFTIINEFSQIFEWIYQTLYNVIVNLSTYSNQILEIAKLLPAPVSGLAIASLSITFTYMIMRLF